jgi:membrane protein YdbS with pleckstrin-like domain
MLKRLNANIIIALCASCGIIAFAFYERYAAANRVPAVAFYVAAAVICLLPVFHALLRHKSCKNKMPS